MAEHVVTQSMGEKPVEQKISAAAPIPEPICFAKELAGEFGGEAIRYQAIAGETYIRDDKGEPVASFFAVAYLRAGVEDTAGRPVAFVFNGGPGSSAQWLHMGAFGPKRVDVPHEPDNIGSPPYPITPNDLSILDISDVVFIDPIGTGYSRTLGGKDQKDYWGLREDARSVSDFIRAWITAYQRWNSPKYLIGESYGTTRAALVADILSSFHIALNGLVLISAVLDYQNSRPRAGDGGILPYVSFLPTYAATAWYHGKVKREKNETLLSFLDEVRVFASTEYASALIANRRLSGDERAQMISRIAAYTGLRESYVEQSCLRISVGRFFKEILRERGVVVGRLDSRYLGVESDNAGESIESDPALDAIASAFTAAFNTHLSELGVQMQRPYVSKRDVSKDWNWMLEDKAPNGGGGYVNVVPHLGRAMRRNCDMRVFVASGYYDLATPFFGAENALSQDGVVQERLSFSYYEVGHMIFLHEPSRVQFLQDVRTFIQKGSAKQKQRRS
jgi:carboxypeptidase C (cathepsin A)